MGRQMGNIQTNTIIEARINVMGPRYLRKSESPKPTCTCRKRIHICLQLLYVKGLPGSMLAAGPVVRITVIPKLYGS